MNRSISKLFIVVILMFTVLIVWTSRWTVFDQSALQNNPLNKIDTYASLQIKRGAIVADNGTVLAKSLKAPGGTWTRKYPFGPLFSQAVGYAVPSEGSLSGLEKSHNTELSGKLRTGLSSVFGPFNSSKTGDEVYSTLDPKAQELARTALAGRTGSVVAMVPQTGAIKVMYSNPSYNDNKPTSVCVKTPGCSLVNLATQARDPAGSTFKVVTATAALDSGKYTPNSMINGHSPITVSGVPLENDNGEEYGEVTLSDALTNSINTVFAQVGQNLGRSTMEDYMKRFGFYSEPPLDYPADQMDASGTRDSHGNLIPVTDGSVDLGRTAIGQATLTVTPLQMAMVASAVANGGVLMKPRLTSKVVNSDGQVVESFSPQVYHQVMKRSTAGELTQMMRNVVEEGTGTAANLEGVQVAGKTGTASLGGSSTLSGGALDDAWFIGFAPVNHPKIAVAVELSSIPNGYGGTYAAPIAAQEIKTLLGENQ